jgi:hypothetical protein
MPSSVIAYQTWDHGTLRAIPSKVKNAYTCSVPEVKFVVGRTGWSFSTPAAKTRSTKAASGLAVTAMAGKGVRNTVGRSASGGTGVAVAVGMSVGVLVGVAVAVGVRGVGEGINVGVVVGTGPGSRSGFCIETIHNAPLAAPSKSSTNVRMVSHLARETDCSRT